MPRVSSANDIINRVAVEVAINTDPDPVASTDESFVQLSGLINAAGQELVELHSWQVLTNVFEFTTQNGDSGTYDLPDDFNSMINQTGWDKSNRVAIGGPLSAQDWSYLDGRDLVSQSIYASFRLVDNKIDLYPQPPPEGLNIRFEYLSRNWVQEAGSEIRKDAVSAGSDLVLLDPLLMVKFLKVKFLQAKGFDYTAASVELDNVFNSRTGKDKGAAILSASSSNRGFPYLHPYYNTSDTGYGIH